MSIFSQKQLNSIVLGVTILLGFFSIYALRDYLNAILGAIILYTIFRPVFLHYIEEKGRNKLGITIAILIISFLIIILPFLFLSWMIIEKLIEFKENPQNFSGILLKIDALFAQEFNMKNFISTSFQSIETWAFNIFPSAFTGMFHITISISITYFLLYFMLMNNYRFEALLVKYLPFNKSNCERLARELKNITYSNVLGQGVIAIIQGSLIGLGFWIFNLKDPLFWATISTILSFLPIVGSPIIFIPAGIIAISNGNSFGGISIIIWGLVLVTNIDNVMRLLINKRIANTHPIITIMGVLIGLQFFGILGLVFGPLMLSIFIILVKVYENSEHTIKKINNSVYH